MNETFDVGFEKYIIFHRGVQRIDIRAVDGVEHLFIVYQDGEEQDLGDPYGDGAREALASARQALADAVAAKNEAVNANNLVGQAYSAAIAAGEAAEARYNQAYDIATQAIEASELTTTQINNMQNTAVDTIHNIDGVVEDPNTHRFSVNFPPTTPSGAIDNIFALNSQTASSEVLASHITLQDIYELWNHLKNHSIYYGACLTAVNDRHKNVDIPSFTPERGKRVTVFFPAPNTAVDGNDVDSYLTLSVNNQNPKRINTGKGYLISGTNVGVLNGFCDFVYEGTYWMLLSFQSNDWNTVIYSENDPPSGLTYPVGTIWLKKKAIQNGST